MPALGGQALGASSPLCTREAFTDTSRPSSAPFVVCKRRRRNIVYARAEQQHASVKREERQWQTELAPRQPLARVPDSLKVASVLSSVDFDLESSDNATHHHRIAGPQNIIGAKWTELPSRWKVVAATSLAFVICNMVSSSQLPQSARYIMSLLHSKIAVRLSVQRLWSCNWLLLHLDCLSVLAKTSDS